MAVEPDLGGIGEEGGDLDEALAEVGVPDIEVIGRHLAAGLEEAEAGQTGTGVAVLLARPDPGQLLGGHDGHHPRTVPPLGPGQVGPDVVDLAVIPAGAIGAGQAQERDAVVLGEGPDVFAEPVADLVEDGRGWDGQSQMVGHEPGHLA